jgi:hypothetical protein
MNAKPANDETRTTPEPKQPPKEELSDEQLASITAGGYGRVFF